VPYPPRTQVPDDEVNRVDLGTMSDMTAANPYLADPATLVTR